MRFRGLAWVLATWFGAGRFPVAPGTIGSLAALPIVYLIAWAGPWVIFELSWILLLVGVWASVVVIKETYASDPQYIVIDEVVGQVLTFLFVSQGQVPLWMLGAGFVLFRFCDIVKPWPACAFDRQHDAFGVMMDDVVAGLYAAGLLYFLSRWI